MCGRYRLTQPQKFAELNDIRLNPLLPLKPRYNIAPTQKVLVVLDESPQEFAQIRWGLIPFWAKDEKVGYSMINAKAETVATKRAYRDAFKRRRCLVAADGFYEWQKVGKGKQPYNIGLSSGEPFAFAGLWERWKNPAGRKFGRAR